MTIVNSLSQHLDKKSMKKTNSSQFASSAQSVEFAHFAQSTQLIELAHIAQLI
jgi:hypothetical protein